MQVFCAVTCSSSNSTSRVTGCKGSHAAVSSIRKFPSETRLALAAEGFGVGHTRATQTKGVWVWGEAQKLPQGIHNSPDLSSQQPSVVYIDTEGFESTGKADAYDDRIFALSTLISAVLVYNLPETVRESDIQKLSFAVDLAEGFYADVQVRLSVCDKLG